MFHIGQSIVNTAGHHAARAQLEIMADWRDLYRTQQRMLMDGFQLASGLFTGRFNSDVELNPIPEFSPKAMLPNTKRQKDAPPRFAFYLQGGGKTGIYQGHMLAAQFRNMNVEPSLLSGTSAGAMNAAIIAYNWAKHRDLPLRARCLKTADALEHFWGDVIAFDEEIMRQNGITTMALISQKFAELVTKHTSDMESGVDDFREIINHVSAPTVVINAMRKADQAIPEDRQIFFTNKPKGDGLPFTRDQLIASAALDAGFIKVLNPVLIEHPIHETITGECVATSSLCCDAGLEANNPPLFEADGLYNGPSHDEALVILLNTNMAKAHRGQKPIASLEDNEKRVWQELEMHAQQSPVSTHVHFADYSTGAQRIKTITGLPRDMRQWAEDGRKAGEAFVQSAITRHHYARPAQSTTLEAA